MDFHPNQYHHPSVCSHSSRPSTAGPVDESSLPPPVSQHHDDDTDTASITALLYHQSDVSITPIMDNPRILKPPSLKFDAKTIPVPPYSGKSLIYNNLIVSDKRE